MSLLEWKEQFSLGVAAMDREHRELVDAMNHVHELATAGADKAAIDRAITHLADLTQRHFDDEERHMEKIGYPDLSRHRRIHKDMLRKVAAHHQIFQAGNGEVDPRFFDFLVHWLAAHICHIDRKYAKHPVPVGT
ncbi:MAG: bacteriohemerythrin [Planctomycetota bacterium]